MNSENHKRALEFIDSAARNKLLITRTELNSLLETNIGEILAQFVSQYKGSEHHLGLYTTTNLQSILEQNISFSQDFGKYLYLKNLGFLFEPELKIDFTQFLLKHSTNCSLFVLWNGEVEDNTLYFLTKEKGIKIDINHISHIIL